MRGHAILTAAAARAIPNAPWRCSPTRRSRVSTPATRPRCSRSPSRAVAALPEHPSVRTRFIAVTTLGMARILGGDGASGADAIHEAITLVEGAPELHDDLRLLPWLTLGPIFLRETDVGRSLIEHALKIARERAAVGALPFVLGLLARDQATTDRWAVAESTYREAIELARESDQRTGLAFGLPGSRGCTRGAGASRPAGRAPPRRWRCRRSSARASMRSGPRRRWASSSSDSATRPRRPSTSSSASACCESSRSPTSTCPRRPSWSTRYLRLGRVDEARAGRRRARRPRPTRRRSRGRWRGRRAAGACVAAGRRDHACISSARCATTSRRPTRSRRRGRSWPTASG